MVHSGVRIRNIHKLIVGHGVHIGEDTFIQAGGGVALGNYVMLGPGVKIWSQNHEYDERGPVREDRYSYARVTIGDNSWIGANSFIMPGVTLPEGSIVSAGSVVGVKRYPAYSIIAGNPARVLGQRQNVTVSVNID